MPWPPRRSTSAELQLKKEITTLQLKLLWTNAELKLKTTYCELNAEYDYLDFGAKAEDFPGAFTVAPQSGLIAATFHPIFNPNISEVKVGLNYKIPPSLSLW